MPKQVDHTERREELAVALWRLVMREGIEAASIRRVASEAGWSSGSLRHYFATQSQLLAFAMDLVMRRARDRVRALAENPDPRAWSEQVLQQLLPLDDERRVEMQVWLAFTMRAAVDPELKALRDEAHTALSDLCRHVAERLGAPARAQDGKRLHAFPRRPGAPRGDRPGDGDARSSEGSVGRGARFAGAPARGWGSGRRRSKALADHVAHRQRDRVLGELHDVEPIATDRQGVFSRPVARRRAGDLDVVFLDGHRSGRPVSRARSSEARRLLTPSAAGSAGLVGKTSNRGGPINSSRGRPTTSQYARLASTMTRSRSTASNGDGAASNSAA